MFYTKCNYEGERINGRIEGRGKFTFANGNTYIGAFQDGLFHGKGTIFFTSQNGGGKYKAAWEKGVAVDGTGVYFFQDGLQYKQRSWEYCTENDRRYWKEHNTFIVPPVAERDGLKRTVIPDYCRGPPPAHLADLEPDEVANVENVNYETTPIEGDPHHLRFTQMPQGGQIKAGIPFTVHVEVQDFYDSIVKGAKPAITLQLGEVDSDGDLKVEETPLRPNHGVAVFTASFSQPGTFTLVATAGRLKAASSVPFEASPLTPRPIQPAASLAFDGIPPQVVSGQEFSLAVVLLDDIGHPVRNARDAVTLFVASGDGVLGGTVTRNAEGGKVLFYDVSYTGIGPFKLGAKCEGVPEAISREVEGVAEIDVSPTKLTFIDLPTDPPRGTPFSIRVAIRDDHGRLAALATHMVDLSLGIGKGTFSVTTPVQADGGHALFEDVMYTGADQFTLFANSPDLVLQPAEMQKPLQAVPSPYHLHITKVDPMQTGLGQPFEVWVEVQDIAHERVKDATTPVRLVLRSGEGYLFGELVARASKGIAHFTDVRYDGDDFFTLGAVDGRDRNAQGVDGIPLEQRGGEGEDGAAVDVDGFGMLETDGHPTYYLQPSYPSKPLYSGDDVRAQPPKAEAGAPHQLSLVCLPTNPPTCFPFTLLVEVYDALGRRCHDATNWINLEIASGTGFLSGTFPIRAVEGAVIFGDLVYSDEDDFVVQAVSNGLLPSTTQMLSLSRRESVVVEEEKPEAESP